MGVDISRALRAPFNDTDWIKKTLLGWLWFLLIVTSPAVYGAMIEYIQRVTRGDERLPEWDDFGGKWVRGLAVAVAGFIYFLPIIVIGAILIIPLVLSANSNLDSLTGILAGGMCLFWVLAAIYGIAVSVLFYAAITNYAMKGHFGAFFEVGAILEKVRTPNAGYFTAWLFSLLVSIIGSAITSVLSLTWVGGLLFGAVMYLQTMIIAHLFGQWSATAYGMAVAPAYGAPPQQPYPPTPPAPMAAPMPPATPPAAVPPMPPAPPVQQPPAPEMPAPPVQPPAAPPAPAPAPEQPEAPAAMPEPAAPVAPPAPPAPEPPPVENPPVEPTSGEDSGAS